MTFEELWEIQQGAFFLERDNIYEFRENLAKFFFRKGAKYANEEIETYKDGMLMWQNAALDLSEKVKGLEADIKILAEENTRLMSAPSISDSINLREEKKVVEAKLSIAKNQRNDLIAAACKFIYMAEPRINSIIRVANRELEDLALEKLRGEK